MSKYFFQLVCLLFIFQAKAQERWNLMSCIDYAYKNNVNLQLSKTNVDLAEVTLKESKYKRLPNLSANIYSGKSYGRNVDPTTNSFTNNNIFYSNYSLSSSVALFQGGLIRNSIKQNDLNYQASDKDYEQAKNDLALNIAVFYLNVLQSQERVHVADQNRAISKIQLDQINKLIAAGSKPEADALEMQSQLARSEEAYVVAENTLDLAWLSLKQSMRMNPSTKISIEPLSEEQFTSLQIQKYSFEDLFNQASESRPGIQASKIRLESAYVGEKIARSLRYPSIGLNASYGSRYSDAAKLFIPVESTQTITGNVLNGTDSVPVTLRYRTLDFKQGDVVSFKKQYDQFLGYGASVVISYPIFNNYTTRGGIAKSKIYTKQSELQLELQKEKLSQDIFQAMTNVKAAIKEYEASLNVFVAAKSSYEKTQKRFDVGMSNVFELNQIQTNYLNAQTNLLISKYDLVFKQKILDYYAGKQISL